MSTTKVALFAAAAVLYVTPAFAQQSQDTLRIAINNPFAVQSDHDLSVDVGLWFACRSSSATTSEKNHA